MQVFGMHEIMKKVIGLILMLSFLARADDLRAQSVSNASARFDLPPNGSYVLAL
jgi:hypothetical protein